MFVPCFTSPLRRRIRSNKVNWWAYLLQYDLLGLPRWSQQINLIFISCWIHKTWSQKGGGSVTTLTRMLMKAEKCSKWIPNIPIFTQLLVHINLHIYGLFERNRRGSFIWDLGSARRRRLRHQRLPSFHIPEAAVKAALWPAPSHSAGDRWNKIITKVHHEGFELLPFSNWTAGDSGWRWGSGKCQNYQRMKLVLKRSDIISRLHCGPNTWCLLIKHFPHKSVRVRTYRYGIFAQHWH